MARKPLDKYLTWFAKYIGVQGLLALGVFTVFIVLTIQDRHINAEFYAILGTIVGFYFAKNGHELVDLVNTNGKDEE